MTTPQPSPRVSPFEAIRHEDEDGEFWSARELAQVLEYAQWRNFVEVVEKAKISCEASGYQVAEHFAETSKEIPIANRGKRLIADFHLSRYGCYLIVQNGDPSKRLVALGQAYFAIQTRRAELMQELESMTYEQQRIALRDQLTELNGQLAEIAAEAGVATQQDFQSFQGSGWRGLYDATRTSLANRRGIKPEALMAHMGPEEELNNVFRLIHTGTKLQRDGVKTAEEASRVHFQVGRVLRRALQEIGATMPEDLPVEPHIDIVRREEARRQKIEAEDRLGLWAQLSDGEHTPDEGNE